MNRLHQSYDQSEDLFDLCEDIDALSDDEEDEGAHTVTVWREIRDQLLKHLVLWSCNPEAEKLYLAIYGRIALATSIMCSFTGMCYEPMPAPAENMKEVPLSKYSVEEGMMHLVQQEKEWEAISYNLGLFKRLESIDALIGSIAFSDGEHPIDAYAEEQGLDIETFLGDVSMSMTRMHVQNAIVSSLIDRDSDEIGRMQDPKIEDFLINYAISYNDDRSSSAFKENFWKLKVGPGELEGVMRDSKAKAKVYSSRDAIKSRRGFGYISKFDAILSRKPWDVYGAIKADESFSEEQRNMYIGALLICIFDCYLSNVHSIYAFLMQNVRMSVDTRTMQDSDSSVLIIRCFGGYHVLYHRQFHFRYSAAAAIRKWAELKYPDKALF